MRERDYRVNAPRSAIVEGDNAREIALHYLEPVSVRVCVSVSQYSREKIVYYY